MLMGNASQTWNIFLSITGLFGVPVAGIFAAGIFTKSANRVSAVWGVLISAALTYWCQVMGVATLVQPIVAFISSFVIAWLIGLITPKYAHDITGLTAKTLNEKVKD